jgi:RNA polymerase sigma-B factor
MLATMTAPSRSERARADRRLFETYRTNRSPDVRAELVERFLPLARHLAARYAYSNEHEDLVQVASYGLVKAIDRFDPERGLAFSSFAVPTIVGELKRYFRDHGWMVRPPRDLQERALLVNGASAKLTARLGRSPTVAELADELDLGAEQVLEALETRSAQHPEPLDAPVESDEDPGDRTRFVAQAEDPGYVRAEAAATLEPLLSRLDERERAILRLRFEEDLTQSEIAAAVGVSQMHVSRLLRQAIATLRLLAADSGAT